MILSNIKKTKKLYPTFLDKSSNSNFTKHLETINSEQLDLYQTLHKLQLMQVLNRPIIIQKIQTSAYKYKLFFNVTLAHLEKIRILKDDAEIYSKTFTDENVSSFEYQHEDQSKNIIPTEEYVIEVTTYDEYFFKKGYPENDIPNDSCFDHDTALDIIGHMLNIDRHNFIPPTDEGEYSTTLPPYNLKKTEDDFYYMERIKHYLQSYNVEYFPTLEIWKYYAMTVGMINRYKILSVQDESYMNPILYSFGDFRINYDYNKIKDFYFNVQANGDFIIPYNIEVAPETKYYCQVKINSAEADLYIKVYYYDNEGDAIHVTNSIHIQTNTPLLFYFYDNSPKGASTARIMIKSNKGFNFTDLRFQKVGALDESSKYMRTKTDYNSCVYDFYGNYNDVPSNLPLPIGDELLGVIQRSLPITKKAFFNLLYHPKSQDQQIQLTESLGLKFEDKLDGLNLLNIFELDKHYIKNTITSEDFYNLAGFTIVNDVLTASEIGGIATTRLIDTNITNLKSNGVGIKFQIRTITDILFETTEKDFTIPNTVSLKDSYLKIISTTSTATLSYIHLYSDSKLQKTDYGETTLLESIDSEDTEKILEIHEGWDENLITKVVATDISCTGTCSLQGDNLSFNNIVTLFENNPLTVVGGKVYTFEVEVFTNPDNIRLETIELDSTGEVVLDTRTDLLWNNTKTKLYYRFRTNTHSTKIYFKIIPLKTGVDYLVGDISCIYENAAGYQLVGAYVGYDALKIDSGFDDLYKIQTGANNMWETLHSNERLPLIIPLKDCQTHLKIIGKQRFRIYGEKYDEE